MPVYVNWNADGYRLPTEAEWVSAFFGPENQEKMFWNSEKITDHGWVDKNSNGHTRPVASKEPGPYGLYDIAGNVREWVWDWPEWNYYRAHNPKGGDKYALFGKRLCGSDYRSPADYTFMKWQEDPSAHRPYAGFRIVRCDKGTHPEVETFTPRISLKIDENDFDPLQGMVHRANLYREGHFKAEGVPELNGIKWKVQTGAPVHSSPIVVDGIVYVGSDDKKVYALNAETGETVWTFATPGKVQSSGAVDDGILYIGDDSGTLHAIDVKTGKAKWQTKDKFHRPLNVAPSPAYGVVFVGTANGGYWAAKQDTGEIVWRFRFSRGPADRSATAIKDGRIYLPTASIHGNLTDIETEQPVWPSTIGASLTAPSIHENRIILTDRWIQALDWETGKRLWQFSTEAPLNLGYRIHSSPAVAEGRVFFGTDYGRLYALNFEDGKEIWRFETDGKAIQSSPSVAQDIVYVGCVDQNLYALDALSGKLIWKQKCGGWINTAPWIDGKTVFIGCEDGYIYAIH
jgi:outer membrane protein assembly factor BamB